MPTHHFVDAAVESLGATGTQGRLPVAPAGEPDPDWQPL
jgi:hypothetical protein